MHIGCKITNINCVEIAVALLKVNKYNLQVLIVLLNALTQEKEKTL